jgi:3-oxoadipate enol-lactonase
MVGEDDTGTPVSMAHEICDNLPGSELEIIPRAAHLSNVEQPERFNAVLLGFLNRLAK